MICSNWLQKITCRPTRSSNYNFKWWWQWFNHLTCLIIRTNINGSNHNIIDAKEILVCRFSFTAVTRRASLSFQSESSGEDPRVLLARNHKVVLPAITWLVVEEGLSGVASATSEDEVNVGLPASRADLTEPNDTMVSIGEVVQFRIKLIRFVIKPLEC